MAIPEAAYDDVPAATLLTEHVVEEDKGCSRNGIESVDFFNMRIDNVTLQEALRAIAIRIAERRPGFIVTPNVDHICRVQRDPEFRLAYLDSFLSLADGVPVLWAGKLFGTPFKEKLSGSDMIHHLSEFAANSGFSLFLLGASDGVAEKAAETLRQKYPGLEVAGTYSPPYGFEKSKDKNEETLRRLREAAPDICILAMSPPRQELWMWHNYKKSEVPVMIGVGGGLDMLVGRVRRAPKMVQRMGLEWFWRLCMEPRRLWRRYLVYDMLFFALIWQRIASGLKSGLTTHARNRT